MRSTRPSGDASEPDNGVKNVGRRSDGERIEYAMTTHHVTFDLDILKEALDRSIENADAQETDAVIIGRAAWVMARSLCDEYEKLADQALKLTNREWFVSYDVTARSIIVQKAGEDEQQITSDEALALRDDLLAAVVAENRTGRMVRSTRPSDRAARRFGGPARSDKSTRQAEGPGGARRHHIGSSSDPAETPPQWPLSL